MSGKSSTFQIGYELLSRPLTSSAEVKNVEKLIDFFEQVKEWDLFILGDANKPRNQAFKAYGIFASAARISSSYGCIHALAEDCIKFLTESLRGEEYRLLNMNVRPLLYALYELDRRRVIR